jgi:integrase
MELFRLTWDKVDLQHNILTVQGKQAANSSESSRRFVPINEFAHRAFEELHRRSAGSEYVCPGDHPVDDGNQQDWRSWFEGAVKRAGVVNFRFHDLRHTFASRLVMEGVPLSAVQELLGHRSIVTTQRYAHLAPDHQKANVGKLAAYAPKPEIAPNNVAVIPRRPLPGKQQKSDPEVPQKLPMGKRRSS